MISQIWQKHFCQYTVQAQSYKCHLFELRIASSDGKGSIFEWLDLMLHPLQITEFQKWNQPTHGSVNWPAPPRWRSNISASTKWNASSWCTFCVHLQGKSVSLQSNSTQKAICPIKPPLRLPTYGCLAMLYYFKSWASSKEAAHSIFKVFGTTRSGFELSTSQTQSGHSNHYAKFVTKVNRYWRNNSTYWK